MDKILLIICDGLADRPIKKLNSKTPLEAARTPNLDFLANKGLVGLVHTVDRGIRPGSDVSHLSLFGYDPKIYYTGRGIYEAIGIGMKLEEGDIAFRGNFATVDKNMRVTDRRAGRVDNTESLIETLQGLKIDGVKISIKKGTGHRVGVVFKGKNLSDKISDVDPHELHEKVYQSKSLDGNPKSKKTADIANKFTQIAYQKLKDHPFNKKRIKTGLPPANIILLRGAGRMSKMPSFSEKYNLSAACIAGAGLYKGIAKSVGMKTIEVTGATGKPNTNIENKVKEVLKALKFYDFIFLHIKGADSLAEDGNYQGKKEFIEKIDRALKPLKNLKNVLIVVTADHTTSSNLKMHTADPVPILISGEGIHTDDIEVFGEHDAHRGRLGHIRGLDLMPTIIDYLGKAPLYGA